MGTNSDGDHDLNDRQNDNSDDPPLPANAGASSLLQIFMVDFLGTLVPGILFLLATALALVPPVRALSHSIPDDPTVPHMSVMADDLLEFASTASNMFWVALFLLGGVSAYLVGHLFYRRDPKEPDRASFNYLKENGPTPEQLDRAFGEMTDEAWESKYGDEPRVDRWLRVNYGCANENECQFPYDYLKDYLKARGHTHLLPLVSTKDHRSKTHINKLKIRLQYFCPNQFRPVVRNEAHVRLSTSAWFAARLLEKVCVVGLGCVVLGLAICYFSTEASPRTLAVWFGLPALFPLVLMFAAIRLRRACNQFIHYQRLREAYYVLELAYTAFRERPHLLESPSILAREVS